MDWIAVAAFFINIIVVAVGWWMVSNRQAKASGTTNGKTTQKLSDAENHMSRIDAQATIDRSTRHPMLSECIELFTSLKKDLGEVKGSLNTLIELQRRDK